MVLHFSPTEPSALRMFKAGKRSQKRAEAGCAGPTLLSLDVQSLCCRELQLRNSAPGPQIQLT